VSREASYLLFGEVILNWWKPEGFRLSDTSGFATRRDVSYKVGGTLEEKVNCYAVGIVGQTGFNGSSVTEGRSLRACR
jgi:hypothetical protein